MNSVCELDESKLRHIAFFFFFLHFCIHHPACPCFVTSHPHSMTALDLRVRSRPTSSSSNPQLNNSYITNYNNNKSTIQMMTLVYPPPTPPPPPFSPSSSAPTSHSAPPSVALSVVGCYIQRPASGSASSAAASSATNSGPASSAAGPAIQVPRHADNERLEALLMHSFCPRQLAAVDQSCRGNLCIQFHILS